MDTYIYVIFGWHVHDQRKKKKKKMADQPISCHGSFSIHPENIRKPLMFSALIERFQWHEMDLMTEIIQS